jgi:hypothetical protein
MGNAEIPQRAPGFSRRPVLGRLVGVCLVGLTLAGILTGVVAGAERAVEDARRVRCADNLREIAMAAIHYTEDKRFGPHVERILVEDGGPDTNHSPKKMRALIYYGYQDDPTAWVCPSSDDASAPVAPEAAQDRRRWFWGGEARPPDEAGLELSPFVDGQVDPVLNDTREVSYEWQRRSGGG